MEEANLYGKSSGKSMANLYMDKDPQAIVNAKERGTLEELARKEMMAQSEYETDGMTPQERGSWEGGFMDGFILACDEVYGFIETKRQHEAKEIASSSEDRPYLVRWDSYKAGSPHDSSTFGKNNEGFVVMARSLAEAKMRIRSESRLNLFHLIIESPDQARLRERERSRTEWGP